MYCIHFLCYLFLRLTGFRFYCRSCYWIESQKIKLENVVFIFYVLTATDLLQVKYLLPLDQLRLVIRNSPSYWTHRMGSNVADFYTTRLQLHLLIDKQFTDYRVDQMKQLHVSLNFAIPFYYFLNTIPHMLKTNWTNTKSKLTDCAQAPISQELFFHNQPNNRPDPKSGLYTEAVILIKNKPTREVHPFAPPLSVYDSHRAVDKQYLSWPFLLVLTFQTAHELAERVGHWFNGRVTVFTAIWETTERPLNIAAITHKVRSNFSTPLYNLERRKLRFYNLLHRGT